MADVQSPPAAQLPEYKSLEKAYGIPVVQDSLSYAHSVFSTNPYTSYVYNTGLAVSTQAFDYSKPIQARLAPLLVRADGVALSGINAVESRFPYPFQTPTEDMIGAVKAQSDQAYSTFYTRVQAPAFGIAQQADKSLSPIVDKLELAVSKISTQPTSTTEPVEDSSQLGRAYRLSVHAKDQIVLLSNEQIKQIQAHNVIVQRAMDTIHKLNGTITAFGKDAQSRVQAASAGIMTEIDKVQTSAASLPSHVQQSTKPLQQQLSQTVTDLRSIIQSPEARTAKEKAGMVASTVQHQVGPVLEALKESYGRFVGGVPADSTTDGNESTSKVVNGNGNGESRHD